MSFMRMVAIGGVYLIACAGWALLGTSTLFRADGFSERLGRDVESLWGGPIVQEAPEFSVEVPGTKRSRKVRPVANQVEVQLALDYRRRGLVRYPTFKTCFRGSYTVRNKEKVAQKVRLHFKFPSAEGTYNDFSFTVKDPGEGGKDAQSSDVPVDTAAGIRQNIVLAPEEEKEVVITYETRGMREWRYRPGGSAGRVQGLDLVVTTDFPDIDFPEGSLSPDRKARKSGGMEITWENSDLITRQDVGVLIPEPLNPGPLAARITFFAPVCLLFFFVLVAAINIVRKLNIHPMHYLFVAAGFFAFHLLFAYLVDHVNVHLAFALAAVATVGLVTGYLTAALGRPFPWKVAGGGQVFYLLLFSYSFFLKGMTGLTVTVGSVLTLAALMVVTAKVDWFDFFSSTRKKKQEQAPLARPVA